MTLQELGFTDKLENFYNQQELDDAVGRIILEHKDRYILKTATEELETELMGNLRFTAEDRYDLPAVGDWVSFIPYEEGKGLIKSILPRNSVLERKAVGKLGQIQIIATNIDYGLVVQAVDLDFNLNRLERYLTICYSAGIEPVVVLSKVDLISSDDVNELVEKVKVRVNDTPVLTVSSQPGGYKSLRSFLSTGKTYCLLGSSGVGKSTLINGLLGSEVMDTGEISDAVHKGKHTTTHRELIVLPEGGIFIDNPGMREVGITDAVQGLEVTFESIQVFAQNCHYKDCTHTHEDGCAVLEALENGELDLGAYENYLKMEKEREHFEADVVEKRKKDKQMGKLFKQVKKHRKNRKY